MSDPQRFIGYCRTSTDDKGQDPLRQRDVIQRWAQRPGPDGRPREVVAWVVDEGTSGGTDPFQRQRVREAIALADEHRAEGIVVEAVDRWTREGMRKLALTEFFLDLDHHLVLEVADLPPGMDEFTREIITGLMAACAKEFRRRLREQVKSGLERARAKGWPKGRPGRKPKPTLTDAEKALVRGMVLEEGQGVDRVALELTKLRGAWDVADRKKAEHLTVKPTWLWVQIHAEMPETAATLACRARGAALRPVRPTKGENRTFQKRRSHRTGRWLADVQVSEPGAQA